MAVEREIKLSFDSAAEAREGVLATGALPFRPRRRQVDTLFDSRDNSLARRSTTLRVRVEDGQSFVTFKGPVQPGVMKTREELETAIGDAAVFVSILGALGFHPGFKYEKYREEFRTPGAILAVDETPVGVFVEIEGEEDAVHALASAMGRAPADYITDSYRTLFLREGARSGNMLFADQPAG
jgi:adenylate cyclase class 2